MPVPASLPFPARLLSRGATAWFVAATLGQWAFVAFIVLFFGVASALRLAAQAEVAARVLRMVCEHEVVAIDGTVVPLNADSVCVHGDSPSAVAMARAVRARLESEGVAIRAFAGDAAASAARD